ncbi:MAG: DNA-binding response regulator [Bacilli bacterium]|nr:DNA-binding response regulator [Bacilli bacterium]
MKALNLVDNTDESIDYINTIHGDSKGWITKAEISKNKEFSQWHYLVGDLLKQDFDKENIYISMSTFYKPIRRIETIKEIGSLFIDLDTYNTQFTKTQILMNLEYNYYNKSIPTPNLIIDSGRGLTLVWSIEKVPYIALPLWKAIQEYLYSQLKEFGADRKALDVTRILRVPGSINSKSGTRVSILEKHEYKYTLREIQNEFLPYLDENRNKKKGRPKKVVYIHRERSLYQNRILDIVKLCELRNYDVKGHREIILFLYRYYLCYFYEDEQKALEDVLELNKEFIQPLGERELIRATSSAEKVFKNKDKQYKYKNETLIELLEISEYEQTHMKIIIGKEEYKRRENIRVKKVYQEQLKSQGKLTEKEKISQRRQKIKALLEEGLLQKDICTILNISKRNCIRDIKFLKEQGKI